MVVTCGGILLLLTTGKRLCDSALLEDEMNEVYQELGKELGLYLLKEEEIPLAAECNAEAYVGYALYDILFHNRCTPEKVNRLWTVSLKMLKDTGFVIADGPKVNAMALFVPPGYTVLPAGTFLRAGGLRLPFSCIKDLSRYQKYNLEVRRKHTNCECWYLLDLAVRPEAKPLGLATKLISPVLDHIRGKGLGCFVETQEKMEVGFFEHHGFEVVETGNIPGSTEKIYSMYFE